MQLACGRAEFLTCGCVIFPAQSASPGCSTTIRSPILVSWFFVLYFGRMLPYLGAAY